jgi:hypothetical protein
LAGREATLGTGLLLFFAASPVASENGHDARFFS